MIDIFKKKNSFNPFDDSFNQSILKYKNYKEDLVKVMNSERNFDFFYNKFLRNSIDPFYFFSESDDDSLNFQNQLKNFQSSHKQFLRNKRGHN